MKAWLRSKCVGEGACPMVACKYNLLLDVSDKGAIKINAGHKPRQMSGREVGYHRPYRVSAEKSSCDTDQLADQIVAWIDAGHPTCLLDLIDESGVQTLERIGSIFGITREAVRQIELRAKRKILSRDPTALREII